MDYGNPAMFWQHLSLAYVNSLIKTDLFKES